jgi:hypothetical protein
MISIQRPGMESLDIHFVLIDFEGTLAGRRVIKPGQVNLLSRVTVYILTAQGKG